MGCQMMAAVESDSPDALQALNQTAGWFETWEQALSRFRPDSELSRVNRSNGATVTVSRTFMDVLQLGLEAAERTDGLVSPTLLQALEAAGYDRSFELVQTSFATITLGHSTTSDWRDIDSDVARSTVRLPPGVRIDLGGVAKGWVADEAARRLSEYGPALVDAGGDIAVCAHDSTSTPFPIGVASPVHPDENIDVVMLAQGGVATSGRDYRRWYRNGKLQHHIVDPRTSMPAITDVMTATAVAPNACEAEVAAKVAFILGSNAGLAWIEAHPNAAALLVLEDGSVVQSSRFMQHSWLAVAAE